MDENRIMKGPLARANNDLDVYKSETEGARTYETAVRQYLKALLKKTEEELKEAVFEGEVLGQQAARAREERNGVYAQFLNAVHEVLKELKFKRLKYGLTCISQPFKATSGTGAHISRSGFSNSPCWELNLGLRNGSPMPFPLGHGESLPWSGYE